MFGRRAYSYRWLFKVIRHIEEGNIEIKGGKNLARIAGVDIPRNKRIEISLTYIFGVGRSTSNEILKKAGVDKDIKVKDLTEEDLGKIRKIMDDYKIEGELRKEIRLNIKRLTDIKCYRGLRHKMGLPVRGQRLRQMQEQEKVQQEWL